MNAVVRAEDLLFWSFVLILNGIIYLPNYVIHRKESSFFPFWRDYINIRRLGILTSTNPDPFRFVNELTVLLIISQLIQHNYITPLIFLIFSVSLIFNYYQIVFRKIYLTEPNLFSDIPALKTGFFIIWSENKKKVILFMLFTVSLLMIVFLLLEYILSLNNEPPGSTFYVITSAYIFLILMKISRHGLYSRYPSDLNSRFHFISVEIFRNLKRTYYFYKLSKKELGFKYKKKRQIDDLKLHTKPNLYLIFMESYGSAFYNRFGSDSISVFNEFSDSLEREGFSVGSNYSDSPIVSGQSWLSFGSVLLGSKISSNTLFENYLNDKDFRQANSLFRVFKKNGYTTYYINPIKPIAGVNVPYHNLKELYGLDEWILNHHIDYEGPLYGFSQCPPDQYTINWSSKEIRRQKNFPYVFFYVTMNSHTPFNYPDFEADWRKLNTQKPTTQNHNFFKRPNSEDYFKAISYQFQYLSDFFNRCVSKKDIAIVLGDHQPPIISNIEMDGYLTPVHVISGNKDFVDGFKEYGFNSGLNEDEKIRHEAIYSILLREWVKNFSSENINIVYEREGLIL